MPTIIRGSNRTSHGKLQSLVCVSRPVQIAPAWLLAQKSWIVPIPAAETARAGGERRRRRDKLSTDELTEIEDATSKIQVQGGRYSEASERMTNL